MPKINGVNLAYYFNILFRRTKKLYKLYIFVTFSSYSVAIIYCFCTRMVFFVPFPIYNEKIYMKKETYN